MKRPVSSLISWILFACLSACGGGVGDDQEKTPVTCGAVTCTDRQTCDESASPPRCKCLDGYTGIDCQACARGFVMDVTGQCLPAPVDCRTNPTVCGGSRGMCVSGQGVAPDTCVCTAGYAGHACQSCADGYQDNDNNGTCLPSCKMVMLTCGPGQVCSDATGRALCACPDNRIGPNCDQCMTGWVLRDNVCVQTCTAVAPTCGPRRYCDESQGMPACMCLSGYTGADCSTCAPGYTADGAGQCVGKAPEGTTLLGAGRYQNSDYLVAINPAAGGVTPLRSVAGLANLRLATDVSTRTIYAFSSTNTLNKLDPITGRLTAVATVRPILSAAFGNGALYTIGSVSPNLLTRISPETGELVDLGPTNLPGAQGMTWDPGGSLLVARPAASQTMGAEFFRVDPVSGAPATLGPLATMDEMRLRPADNRLAVAFDTAGKLYMVTRLGRTAAEIVSEHCRKAAAALGYAGYEAAPFTTMEIEYNGIGAGLTKVLASKAEGKEMIAYASYGRRLATKANMRIETTNPEAFVCVSTYEEVLELQIPAATARFAGIVVSGYQPNLALLVEGAVPAVTRPTLHVHAARGTVAPAFMAYQFSKVYTTTEWNALRLASYVSAWDSDQMAPALLVEVNLETRSITRVLNFPGLELFPILAPWAP
jgi:hypothetical protein